MFFLFCVETFCLSENFFPSFYVLNKKGIYSDKIKGDTIIKQAKNALSNEDWVQADGYQEGTYAKILRDENGGKTILLQLPEGFYMAPHSHITTEQHFVLDGEYVSNDVKYTVGTYQRFAPGDEHGPFSSETGALILVCWDPLEIKKSE